MEKIKLTINGIKTEVEQGSTILEAAKSVGVYIPTLCHLNLDGFEICNEVSSCRVCMVEVEGRPALVTACSENALRVWSSILIRYVH